MNALFLIGEQDELIPPWMGKDLKDCLKTGGKLALFPTGMHNDTYMKGGAAYWAAIKEFTKDTSSSVAYKG